MKKWLTLIISSFLIMTGCSRMDMAYSFAPRLVANQLEDAFDLSSARYRKIKQVIENDLKSHKTELKTEATLLIDSLLKVADNKALTTEEIRQIFASGRELQNRVIFLMRPSFEEVMGSLSREELTNLKVYSEEKFKKSDERFADFEKFKENALESFEKHMETFFDSVSAEQKKMYTEFLLENFDYYKSQLEVRKTFVSKLESLIDDKPELVNYVLKYYSGDASIKSEEHRKKQDVFFQHMFIAAGNIWQTLTDRQRTEFKKTLNSMRSDLERL